MAFYTNKTKDDLKKELQRSCIHDGIVNSFLFDLQSGSVVILLTNTFFQKKMKMIFGGVKAIEYNTEQCDNDCEEFYRSALIIVTVEEDNNDGIDREVKNEANIHVCYQFLSMAELHICAETVTIDPSF